MLLGIPSLGIIAIILELIAGYLVVGAFIRSLKSS